MRCFAFIMTLVLLTLTFEPAVSALVTKENVETACCDHCRKQTQDKQGNKKQGDNNKSNDNNCNPFQSCSNCLGFIIGYPQINFIARPFISKQLSLLTIQIKPQFYPDFWQPPKIS